MGSHANLAQVRMKDLQLAEGDLDTLHANLAQERMEGLQLTEGDLATLQARGIDTGVALACYQRACGIKGWACSKAPGKILGKEVRSISVP